MNGEKELHSLEVIGINELTNAFVLIVSNRERGDEYSKKANEALE